MDGLNAATFSNLLEGKALNPDEISLALQDDRLAESLPLLCGSGVKNIGVNLLMDVIVGSFPSPLEHTPMKATNTKTKQEVEVKPLENAPFCGLVFKTVANPFRGKLSLVKVCGNQPADSNTYNATKGTRERIGQMFVLNGDPSEGINPARIGDSRDPQAERTQSGDTLCIENTPVVLPPIVWPIHHTHRTCSARVPDGTSIPAAR